VSSWNIEHWSNSIKSAYSFSNSSWFHKMSKNHLYLASGIISVSNLIVWFKKVMVEHIRQAEKTRADAFSRLATTNKKSHHRSVVQIHFTNPSVGEAECLTVIEADTWMTPIIQYLELDTCKPEEEKTMRQQCARYTMKGLVRTTRAGERWPPRYSEPGISSRQSRTTVQNMWRNVPSAKITAPYLTSSPRHSQHGVSMAVCHLGNEHHWSLQPKK